MVYDFRDKWRINSAWISNSSSYDSDFVVGACMTIDASGQWTDADCAEEHYFTCQFPEGSLTLSLCHHFKVHDVR